MILVCCIGGYRLRGWLRRLGGREKGRGRIGRVMSGIRLGCGRGPETNALESNWIGKWDRYPGWIASGDIGCAFEWRISTLVFMDSVKVLWDIMITVRGVGDLRHGLSVGISTKPFLLCSENFPSTALS